MLRTGRGGQGTAAHVSPENLRWAIRLADGDAELGVCHAQLAGIEPCHNLDGADGAELTNYLRPAQNTIAPSALVES